MKNIQAKKKGFEGELIARNYFLKNGYKIIEKNFYSKKGEIDLIILKGSTISFVEVKNYKKNSLINPLYMITEKKKKNIRKTAEFYLLKTKDIDKFTYKFDVVTIEENKIKQHIENAF